MLNFYAETKNKNSPFDYSKKNQCNGFWVIEATSFCLFFFGEKCATSFCWHYEDHISYIRLISQKGMSFSERFI